MHNLIILFFTTGIWTLMVSEELNQAPLPPQSHCTYCKKKRFISYILYFIKIL